MKRILTVLLILVLGVTRAFAGDDGILHVLAIGNSFSQDAVEQNLWNIAAADGVQMVIGNMYIGGCSIERHVNNIRDDKADYAYRKVAVDGSFSTVEHFTLAKAIIDEKWDYVSVQQASHYSGKLETYELLPELVAWIHENAPEAKVIFHQTWAYPNGSNHPSFPDYDSDCEEMYDDIMHAVKKATKRNDIDIIVPSGTAIQNGRANPVLGENLTRDGFHMDLRIGRYLIACAWYETLTGITPVRNAFVPTVKGSANGGRYDPKLSDPSAEEILAAQKAAHAAVKHPFKVTKLRKQ